MLAYACDPYLGSEEGAGWAMVRTAAAVGDVTALISAEHMEAIDRWLGDHPEHRDVRFVPVASPATRSVFGRLIEMDRRIEFVAYLRWLRGAGEIGRQLNAEAPFDVSLHGGYGSYWMPTSLVDIPGVPCVWGPVGGGTRTPRALWRYLGVVGWFGEIQKSIALAVACRMPSVRRTWEKAPVHLFETTETLDAMPARYRDRAQVINRVMLYDLPDFVTRDFDAGDGEKRPVMLFPSLLEPRKGPMLALRALAHTPPEVRLVFVNDGYDRKRLERAARKLGLEDRVEFLGRIPRTDMMRMVRESAAVIFTGTREEGGMALVEAMMSGAPVVVLANGGPRLIAEHAIDSNRVAAVTPTTGKGTVAALGAAMTSFYEHPPAGTSSNLEQDSSKKQIHATLRDTAVTPAR